MWIKYRHQHSYPKDHYEWKDIGNNNIDDTLDDLEEEIQMLWETDREVEFEYDVFEFPPREVVAKHIRGAQETIKRWRNRLNELQELLEKIPCG